MFLQRRASLLPRPKGLTDSSVSAEISKASTCHLESEPSSSGLTSYLAFSRLRLVNSPVSAMIRPPGFRAPTLVFSAAGFIATSTSGASPAVSMLVEPKLIWNAETPNSVPCGARISAGKSGKVAKSLPASALDRVNCPPVSCIPSPESPAKRTTTASGALVERASGSANCVAMRLPHQADRSASSSRSALVPSSPARQSRKSVRQATGTTRGVPRRLVKWQ